MMSIIEIIILLLMIIGVVGVGWLILAFLFMVYGWFETKLIRKKIPEKIKREVETKRNEQQERRDEYARANREPNLRKSESISTNQSIPRDEQVRGRSNVPIQSTGNTPRSKPSSKIEWADFSEYR